MAVHDETVGMLEADAIAADVSRHHLAHMRMCTVCTWWYCDHYSCDCHESCAGMHDAAGNPQ